jgi:hypothetical protein
LSDRAIPFGEDAVAALDEAARECGRALGPGMREQLAVLLLEKGMVLNELERPDDALATLNELISRFEPHEREAIQRVVATAQDVRGQLLEQQY